MTQQRLNNLAMLNMNYDVARSLEFAKMVKGGGGGGGGGVTLIFFVKLGCKIAVDQQTRAREQNFEGVPDPGCPRDSHAATPIFGQFLAQFC